jgi:tRNA threonylcarbamoyladenosine biosynthesis protein TsaE
MSGIHPAIVGTPEPLGTARWLWSDESATQAFAQALAQHAPLQNAYIELVGDLGAGKTTFVRHLLQALGVHGRIKSPTYAVVEPHAGIHPVSQQPLAIWHFDFYRFNDPQEFEEAGFRDLFASVALKIAEWPQQAQGMLPEPDLQLKIQMDDQEARHVQVDARTPEGLLILQGLLTNFPAKTSPPFCAATAHENSTT